MRNKLYLTIISLFFLTSAFAAKKALIFGVTGQDGAYLSEFLLEKGYEVHGIKRRSSSLNTQRVDHLYNNKMFHLHYGDLTDMANLTAIIAKIQPDEIYNLGAQSHVKVSFELPDYTAQVDALGTLHILEAVRLLELKNTKIYQASTSELFGKVVETPQKETTPFYPRSPYGVAKMYGYWIIKNYREAYNMFACNGILFNHESPIRGETFVTRKITLAAANIRLGLQDCLYLGNLDAKRDWGYAKDYVEAMWLMLQKETPDDYVVATGETHTVKEFVELAFQHVGINLRFEGTGIDEVGIDTKTNKILVRIDPIYFRPTDVELLLGDCSKSKEILQWTPRTTFKALVEMMAKSDLQNIMKEHHIEKLPD